MSLLYGAVEAKTRLKLCDIPKGENDLAPKMNLHRRVAAAGFGRRLFVVSLLLILPAAHAYAAAAARQEAARIVTASGVRLRERPDAGSAEVGRLQLGAVVRVQERGAERARVGEAEDYWYMVSAPEGARGWVFGGLTAAYDSARRDDIYARLSKERLANASATFAELSELVRFLDRATKQVTRREALGELELTRLSALARSLASFSIEDQEKPPYKAWTAEHEREIVYSEPAGQWFVRGDRFWDLQRKYRDLPLAERAAWEGAQTPLPGECEGFLPCYFYSHSVTYGKYLQLYPRGAHAEAALASISEFLGHVVEDMRGSNPVFAVESADRTEFRKTAATLRAQIAAAASPRKVQTLRQFDTVVRRFR